MIPSRWSVRARSARGHRGSAWIVLWLRLCQTRPRETVAAVVALVVAIAAAAAAVAEAAVITAALAGLTALLVLIRDGLSAPDEA